MGYNYPAGANLIAMIGPFQVVDTPKIPRTGLKTELCHVLLETEVDLLPCGVTYLSHTQLPLLYKTLQASLRRLSDGPTPWRELVREIEKKKAEHSDSEQSFDLREFESMAKIAQRSQLSLAYLREGIRRFEQLFPMVKPSPEPIRFDLPKDIEPAQAIKLFPQLIVQAMTWLPPFAMVEISQAALRQLGRAQGPPSPQWLTGDHVGQYGRFHLYEALVADADGAIRLTDSLLIYLFDPASESYRQVGLMSRAEQAPIPFRQRLLIHRAILQHLALVRERLVHPTNQEYNAVLLPMLEEKQRLLEQLEGALQELYQQLLGRRA